MTTYIDIYGVEYGFCRSAKASYSDKHNRMVKLAERFEELSDKFDGMIIRGQVGSFQARLALACKLMMYSGIRIGNEGSAEGYMTKPHPNSKKEPEFVQTYGLTTIRKEHVTFKRGKAYLNFLGKKQVDNSFTFVGDTAKYLKALYEMTTDNETLFEISVYELTKFIKKYVGKHFTPKDFRTMRANMVAYETLSEICERELPTTKSELNKEKKEIAVTVSEALNNTPGVCKASYIDERIWEEVEYLRPVTKNKK